MTTVLRDALTFQLDTAYEHIASLCEGLTDEEYFWEPVPGCFSVRRNLGTNPPELFKSSPNTRDWYAEHGWLGDGWTPQPPDGDPLTTIAWLLTHVVGCKVNYHQEAFDSGARSFDDIVPTNPDDATKMLHDAHLQLRDTLLLLDDDALQQPDIGSRPQAERNSFVKGLPLWRLFVTIINHDHQHGSDIGRMRDFYRRVAHG